MSRLLYEQSISYGGHLIIPFVRQCLMGHDLYSYRLLSEWGYKGHLHRSVNPSGLYSCSAEGIIQIAKVFLDDEADACDAADEAAMPLRDQRPSAQLFRKDYFKDRYTYRNHLIIIFHARQKYFYDHYPPHSLKNIAAPKIFNTERSCLTWIKDGIDAAKPSANVLYQGGSR